MNCSDRYKRLIDRGLVSPEELGRLSEESRSSGACIEQALLDRGIPKHELLFSLAECYGRPFVEYEESVVVSHTLARTLDLQRLKHELWVPLSAGKGRAEVIACDPSDPPMLEEIRRLFPGAEVDFSVALPRDIVRIIEHNQDLNPNFTPTGGRTPLAKVRTFLADRRSLMSWFRTSLAKGRTGLAMFRTGISFTAIALALFRVFGYGWHNIIEAALIALGAVLFYEGAKWYHPARSIGKQAISCRDTGATGGTTVLELINPGNTPGFVRSAPIPGAAGLRALWERLSPVMRRRFLASDRTDFAEERTLLACYRTVMAKARTGLAFTRSGIAMIGLGVAFLRAFPAGGPWTVFDFALITVGLLMTAEGFYWYLPGRTAGRTCMVFINAADCAPSFWDTIVPPSHKGVDLETFRHGRPPVHAGQTPGIWATTGHALERTLLAERRNVMARLRTVMARSRTGLALIRTGLSIASVGLGLQVYFGLGNPYWTAFNSALMITGLVFAADGLYWHVPANRIRRQLPYCFGDIEITVPNYGVPSNEWKRAVFRHG